MTKRQKEILILLLIVVGIGGVLAYTFITPPVVPLSTYAPQAIDTDVEPEVLKNPEFRDLSPQPVPLPVRPVPTGRDNPYIPY